MDNVRDGERLVPWVERQDASLIYIGRIHTPWTDLSDCPRQGRLDGPLCRIEVFEPWTLALSGITVGQQAEVLYWLHLSRRDLVQQCPRNDGNARGTFSIRSPIRPNPIGTTVVKVESIEGNVLTVRGMDCLDGTPLIDLKPDLAQFVPLAKEKPGDRQVG
nr:tRNA (N6-threonylcarbamoyladenosine(37)-N6)-methyltransferase TrmO [Oryzibacter oryziterrae]